MEDKLLMRLREFEYGNNTPEEKEEEKKEEKPEAKADEAVIDLKRCEGLAEKLYIVKHLQGQKEITEKQKVFVEETINIELTEKERDVVLEMYTKLLEPKGKEKK